MENVADALSGGERHGLPVVLVDPAGGQFLTRRMPAGPQSFNREDRSCTATIATSRPVRRPAPAPDGTMSSWDEVLLISSEAIDISRLQGAPVLIGHNASRENHIGVVVSGRIENGRALVADIQFSGRGEIAAIVEDVAAGILRQTSCGYRVSSWKRQPAAPFPTFTAERWQPIEISLLPLAADGACIVRGHNLAEAIMPDSVNVEPVEASEATQASTWSLDDFSSLLRSAEKLGVKPSFVDELRTRNLDLETARTAIINHRAELDERVVTRGHRIETGHSFDNPRDRAAAMAEGVYTRIFPQHQPSEAARPYVGLTFTDLARECLRHAGERTSGLSPMSLITRAYQSTSDFPLIAGGAVERELMRIYAAAPRGVLQCARFITNRDFRAKTLVTFEGGNIDLEKVNEAGEFRHGTLVESGESVKIETFGKIVSWTRQMAVNDDLDALQRIPQLLAAAAVAKEDDLAVALLTSGTNANGPTLSDGQQVFSAAHGNLAAGGDVGAPSEATLTAARLAIRKQEGPNGQVLGIEPSILLVPASLETVAKKQVAAVQATEVASVNAFTDLTVVTDPRLDAKSATAWYLVGSPQLHDGLAFAHLEGERGPQLATKVGFEVDGTQMRVRLDAGVAFLDWRSWFRNPGA